MQLTQTFKIAIGSAMVLLLNQGCSNAQFETIDQAAKEKVLTEVSVMDNESSENSAPRTETTSQEFSLPGAANLQIENGEIVIRRNCSDSLVIRNQEASFSRAKSLKLKIYKEGRLVCQSSDTLKIWTELYKGLLPLQAFCNFSSQNVSGNLTASLVNENGRELLYGSNDLIFADNPFESSFVPQFQDPATYELCDVKVSPLFVDLRKEGSAGFSMTAPNQGILFDIQGENAKPLPHTKKQISWFKDSSMAMLVLPRNGRVEGINELFGDNTRGPDGKFAAHGFAALAKYDNQDGVIDSSDEIFSKLSLWIDHDLNGIAAPGEILSIAYLGISAIDLQFDDQFSETDKYGNEVKFKSVVKMNDGSYKMIYDMWFWLRN